MPYPESPFATEFDVNLLAKLSDDDDTTVTGIQIEEVLKWLCQTPEITSVRTNRLKCEPGELLERIQTRVEKVLGANVSRIQLGVHPQLEELILIHHHKPHDNLQPHPKEVIVDAICGAAVLRGAHIFAPGVLGMPSNVQTGNNVSIYADLAKECRKGHAKIYKKPKLFLGNGIVRMCREDFFCETPKLTGVAVEVTETISGCPSLGDDFLQNFGLLQNVPSIICVHVLDPRPGDIILDMCASPGNKTTHIADLMQNQGKLFAVDKTPSKLAQLKSNCENFGAKVEAIQADSSKLIDNNIFPPENFDKILLDAPCSALGKRPQLLNTTSEKVLRSFVPLQRKLFKSAVSLLKKNGVLVYSTCTITLAENEGIVSWVLREYPGMELVEASPKLAGPGWKGTSLSEEDLGKVQRFGPNQNCDDSVGFFIAKFLKIK